MVLCITWVYFYGKINQKDELGKPKILQESLLDLEIFVLGYS